jgi:GWxTD domain-containing protein
MRPFRQHVVFSLLLLVPFLGADAQERPQPQGKQLLRQQPFFFEALNFGQYDPYGITTHVDIYVQVPFDLITFVKKDNAYMAIYTVTATFTDEDGRQLKEETWTRRIERTSFESTVDPGFSDLSQRSFVIDPGPAIVSLTVEDKESEKEYRLTKKITVRRFDPNLPGISDIMLINSVEYRDGKRQLSPQLESNVAGLKDGFSLFFEIYNPLKLSEVFIRYSILQRGNVTMRKTERQSIKPGGNTYLSKIATAAFPVGSYALDVEVMRPDDTTETGILVKESKPFIVNWLSGGTPVAINDLDEAIDQLKYFAKADDVDHIREAPDEKEKRRRFEQFWEKNNPVPGAPSNRAMTEYYSRVAYANEHYRHYVAGWKTDRGMVYIIYGKADMVERHPMEADAKPYEVWEYYDLNRRFVFVDDMGFGDYRLLYPMWDDRTRLR